MDSGVAAAERFELAVGVALTPEQMGQLTDDLVWLVKQNVDGHDVLVPVVYLSAARAASVASDGSVVAGSTVNINASGTLDQAGRVQASKDASLKAGTLLNKGAVSAAGTLSLSAAQDILNTGSVSGGNVSVVAGRDLTSRNDARVDMGFAAGGAITATGNLMAQAGRDLAIAAVPITAGRDLGLAAGRDINLTAAPIKAAGDAQIVAGRDLNLIATGKTQANLLPNGIAESTTHSVTTITADGNALLAAGRDLNSQGAEASGQTLTASAGRDIALNTVTDREITRTGGKEGRKVTSAIQFDETLRGTSLAGTEGVLLVAGRDLSATAAAVSSERGGVALSAGRDLNLETANETHSREQNTKTKSGNLVKKKITKTHDKTTDTYAVGTTLDGNQVTLAAGRDINAQAAQVNAENAVSLFAGRDVNLTAAQNIRSEEHSRTVKTTNFAKVGPAGDLNYQARKAVTDGSSEQRTAVGTLLSGGSVTVAASRDLTTQAAQIASDGDVTLAAGNNLTLGTAVSSYTESQGKRVSTTGYIRDGLNVTIGEAKNKNTTTYSEITPTGTLVGSTAGSVTLSAGNDIRITGSDLISQTGTTIVGKNVTVEAAVSTSTSTQTFKQSQGGVTGGLGGKVANATQNAVNSGKRTMEVSDPRLKALYAAKTAYAVSDALSANAGPAGKFAESEEDVRKGAISVQIGLGASSASSKLSTYDEAARGSVIRSQGDITIAATGGDLNIIGSEVAGKNVALAAANNLNVISQVEKHTMKSDSKNAGGSVGVQFGSDGVGFYVEASAGKSKGRGNGLTHAESTIKADNVLTLLAGNDATIKGAQLTGDSVLAAIGGNLRIESEQDTDDFSSRTMQAGAKVVWGAGASVSANYSQGKVDSKYKSVNEITGISAGNGGFDITVGGNTHLKGGVITSSAGASKNILDTGTLTFEHLENEAKYKASQFAISGSSSGSANQNMLSGAGGALSAAIPVGDKSNSTTQAGIAQGQIIVRDGPADLTGLNRAPTMDNQSLKPIFDEKKVAEQMELGQVAGEVGMRAVGDISHYMANKAATEAEQKAWSDGGTNKIILHGLVGAAAAALANGDIAGGGIGAASSEVLSGFVADYLRDHTDVPPNSPLGKLFGEMTASAIGAATGGGAGAATALQGEQFNRVLHPEYLRRLDGAAEAFAAEQGISKEEARDRLIVQAYRTQDARFDDTLAGQGKADDAAAMMFLRGTSEGWTDPSTGKFIDLTFAGSDRDDASGFANTLYQDKQAREWFQQATGLSNDYLDVLARQDYFGNQMPAYGLDFADWQTRQTLRELGGYTPLGSWANIGELAYNGRFEDASREAGSELLLGAVAGGSAKVIGKIATAVKTTIKNTNRVPIADVVSDLKKLPSSSPNSALALNKKLSSVADAQNSAEKTRVLPDGRIRYYEKEKLASKPGPTRGASFVTEVDPATGRVRQWMESYDHLGNVVRVHPKQINGQTIASPHYPPTGEELNR